MKKHWFHTFRGWFPKRIRGRASEETREKVLNFVKLLHPGERFTAPWVAMKLDLTVGQAEDGLRKARIMGLVGGGPAARNLPPWNESIPTWIKLPIPDPPGLDE